MCKNQDISRFAYVLKKKKFEQCIDSLIIITLDKKKNANIFFQRKFRNDNIITSSNSYI